MPTSDPLRSSGVLGSERRYPLSEPRPPALRLGGSSVLPVGPLRVYSCGITPYDVTHVGHAATFVRADLLTRVARAAGCGTRLVRNVTDIDDVLSEAAHARGRHYDELALTQEFHVERDLTALGCVPPDASPHARAHVGTVVRLAAALLERGAAYETGGHVWFRGADVPARVGWDEAAALAASREYGDQPDTAAAAARESVFDVAVWRPSGEDDPAWPSPWGWGRPGWHAECAAMALHELGPVDVLVGGADLAFPHHAYQQAMAEAATGVTPFARTVLHVGEVRRGGAKMAKSTGNLVLVADLLAEHAPSVLRLALLDRPLAAPWEYDDRALVRAADRLAQLQARAGSTPGDDRDPDVLAALLDGLDVPAAVDLGLAGSGRAAATALDLLGLPPA